MPGPVAALQASGCFGQRRWHCRQQGRWLLRAGDRAQPDRAAAVQTLAALD